MDEPASNRLDYNGLKALAVQLRRPVHSLYVLSAGNDPFFTTPSRAKAGRWFADLWETLPFRRGVHLRRIHYILVSQAAPIRLPDGTPYTNTERCWQKLLSASAAARYLGLVPVDAFVDRRNAEPFIRLVEEEAAEIGIADVEPFGLATLAFPDLPSLWLRKEPVLAQRYAVELWAEKTTVNDILMPLASEFGLNVVTGAGELSITICNDLVRRARRHRRPVRVLYVSDFDPAGLSMPVAASRKIEHAARETGEDLDIEVRPVVLTADQCREYSLPRTPIKKTEKRAARFEARNGEGATELDALEALHPGLLRQILIAEIKRYHDGTFASRTAQALAQYRVHLAGVSRAVLERHRAEVDALRAEWDDVAARAAAWEDRAGPVWHAIAQELQAEAADLDDIEWPEPAAGREDPDPLFSSRRPYLEQIERYKRHQDRPTERRPSKRKAPTLPGILDAGSGRT